MRERIRKASVSHQGLGHLALRPAIEWRNEGFPPGSLEGTAAQGMATSAVVLDDRGVVLLKLAAWTPGRAIRVMPVEPGDGDCLAVLRDTELVTRHSGDNLNDGRHPPPVRCLVTALLKSAEATLSGCQQLGCGWQGH